MRPIVFKEQCILMMYCNLPSYFHLKIGPELDLKYTDQQLCVSSTSFNMAARITEMWWFSLYSFLCSDSPSDLCLE